mmetsp:Transcript_70093/g.221327  ORF Transcript_70093/g.221327 Transcript_70093/m.221327 type:complete len:227 (-) Transcript_70093:455-1135(-)
MLEPGRATRSVFGATRAAAKPGTTTAWECAAQKGRSCRARTRRPASSSQAVQSEKQRARCSPRAGRRSSRSAMPLYARARGATRHARVRRGRKGRTARHTSSIGRLAQAASPGGMGASPAPIAGTTRRGIHLEPHRVGVSAQSTRTAASEQARNRGGDVRPKLFGLAGSVTQSAKRPSRRAARMPTPMATSMSTMATSLTPMRAAPNSTAGPAARLSSAVARKCQR